MAKTRGILNTKKRYCIICYNLLSTLAASRSLANGQIVELGWPHRLKGVNLKPCGQVSKPTFLNGKGTGIFCNA